MKHRCSVPVIFRFPIRNLRSSVTAHWIIFTGAWSQGCGSAELCLYLPNETLLCQDLPLSQALTDCAFPIALFAFKTFLFL